MNNDSILHWLLSRKINQETLDLFNIQCEKNITIPVHDADGVFLFNKYRRNPFLPDTGPKYWYDKTGSYQLFGAHLIKNKDIVVYCEGELDALVLWSHNIPAVTSTGGASSFNENWIAHFVNKEVYLCLDNDFAGSHGAVRVLSFLPNAKVIILPDTAQIKDVTDYYMRGGDLRSLMASAKQFLNEEDVRVDMQARKGVWQSTLFHEAWLEWKEKQERKIENASQERKNISNDIEKARAYPIKSLLTVNRNGKTRCLFHNEKTASMHVFKDNHAFCFGCSRYADAIDIYRELNGCGFKEAVEALNKLS